MFDRNAHYSQTEACKKFKISAKAFNQIIEDYNLDVTENPITLHTCPEGKPYTVTAKYVNKIDFIRGLAFFKKWVTLDVERPAP